jgi:hypothetical protein
MGLTIHYTIEYRGTVKQLQQKLEKVRQQCRDLPFEEVGEVGTIKITKALIDLWNYYQKSCSEGRTTVEQRNKHFAELGITPWQMVELGEWREEGNKYWKDQKPTTMVSLPLWPGEGCESSDLNFQRIRGRFRCKSFCKTQYAEEFVKCHLLVIKLLDLLKAEGFKVDVYDEGQYHETRDLKVLGKNINESTAMIEGLFGSLKSAAGEKGMAVDAPIEKCKNIMRVDEE